MTLDSATTGGPEHPLERPTLLNQRTATWLATALLLLGLAARVAAFAHGRALWLDELLLALNLIERDFAGLWQPLDNGQFAPVGFLMLVKATIVTFGQSEQAFRLVSLIAGSGALIGFFLLARRTLPPTGWVVGVCLFACLPNLIFYSNEVKPYSLDLFAVVTMFLLTLWVWDDERSVARWVVLGVAGLLFILFSHAVILALGGIGLVLGIDLLRRRRIGLAACVAGIGAAWAGLFVLLLMLVYHYGAESETLQTYWQHAFIPPDVVSIDGAEWVIKTWYDMLQGQALGGASGVRVDELTGLWSFLFIAGVVAMVRHNPRLLLLVLSPLLFLVLAAALEAYPISGRLIHFWNCIKLLVVAWGAALLIDRVAAATRAGGAVLLAGLLVFPLMAGTYLTMKPFQFEESRGIYEQLSQRIEDDQPVYCTLNSIASFMFYAPRTGLGDVEMVKGRYAAGELHLIHEEVDRIAGLADQVWVVSTHRYAENRIDDQSLLSLELSLRGEQVDQIEIAGYTATLYHFDDAPGGEDASGAGG